MRPTERDIEQARALQAQAASHPGLLARQVWDNIHSIYAGVYLGNRSELEALVRVPKTDFPLAAELVQNVHDAAVRKNYSDQLVRLFHNYVAATQTLVEHSRRMMNGYEGSTFAQEYEQRKSAFAAAPAHLLVKDLRNYTLHVAIPPFEWEFGFKRDEDYTFEFYLRSDELLASKKLSSGARAAIVAQGSRVELEKLVADHGALVDELYGWLFGQFQDLHGDDIDDYNTIAAEVNTLLGKPPGPNEVR